MSFTIRTATADDYEALRGVFTGLIDMHVRLLPHIFHHPDDSYLTKQDFCDYLSQHDRAVFVAEQAGRVVGGLYIRLTQTPHSSVLNAREYAYIEHVAVQEQFRQQGVGQALIARAHEWAKGKGLNTVELHVKAFNKKAIGFYEKLGYTIKRLEMWKSLQ
jgi:ribosomal protein S18 acetylase RimI-like enzyme